MEIDRNKILTQMFNELKEAPSIYQPSSFWIDLNKIHLKQLMDTNIDSFKRSVNMRYFNWGVLAIIRHQLSIALSQILKGNFKPILKSKFIYSDSKSKKKFKRFSFMSAFVYKVFVSSFADHISQIDYLNLLDQIEEPLTGNPFVINYKNKLISQDLCNSIHEFYTIQQSVTFPKKMKIAELGAGYGRLAFIFLKVLPDSSYCIIDIPPALYVSQNYLSAIFPGEKVFKFRPFPSFKKVKKEFEESRIRFLMPHQIKLLPKKQFDLFITISSLHEMRRDQIRNYIRQIDRLTKGYFYSKQWQRSRTSDNQNIKEHEYPLPKKWKIILRNSPHPIQSMFFDALYKIP